MELGTRIRKARETKGLSTTQLAFHLDRSAQTVIAYESGKVKPTVPVIQQMAEILGVSIDELVADVEFSAGGGE